MKPKFRWLAAALLAGSTMAACGAATAVVARSSEAYVVKGNIFGSDTYYCVVQDERPICYEVNEHELD